MAPKKGAVKAVSERTKTSKTAAVAATNPEANVTPPAEDTPPRSRRTGGGGAWTRRTGERQHQKVSFRRNWSTKMKTRRKTPKSPSMPET